MQPIPLHPRDNEQDTEYDFSERYETGPSVGKAIAVVITLLLMLSVIMVLATNSGSGNEQTPVPTEAPLDPGV